MIREGMCAPLCAAQRSAHLCARSDLWYITERALVSALAVTVALAVAVAVVVLW
jgi:hypothetical protein